MLSLANFPVLCNGSKCAAAATFKIASRWSDGLTHEWKTYYLCCEQCLPELYREACRKQQECRLTLGETLAVPNILERGQPMKLRSDLEVV